jgi:nitroreductase
VEDLLEVMYTRRSIREYTDEPVTDEQVETMLKAAMAAPSFQNLCPWHFVVVRKRKLLDKLAETHKYAHMLTKAPLAVAVCGDTEISERHWVEDTCAATQNLLLAVTAVGLGGVWISVYPNKKRMKYVGQMLDVPDDIEVLCLVAVGHPSEEQQAHTQYDPKRVHYDRWRPERGEK